MRPVLAVDVCNTLAAVNAEIARLAGKTAREHYGLEDLGYTDPGAFFGGHPWVFEDAAPLPDSLKTARRLGESFRIIYLSARPGWARGVTERWLRRHGYPDGRLVLTKDKGRAAKRLQPYAAIDDSPDEVARISPVCRVLVPAQPYNDFLGGQSWKEILAEF